MAGEYRISLPAVKVRRTLFLMKLFGPGSRPESSGRSCRGLSSRRRIVPHHSKIMVICAAARISSRTRSLS